MNASTPFEAHPSADPEGTVLAICPLCDMSLQPLASRVLGQRGNTHLLFFECHRCGSGSLAVIEAGPGGVSSFGALTDLTPVEVMPWTNVAPIGDDDVIAAVDRLRNDDRIIRTIDRPSL